ncbi:Hydroxymethylbilane synthase [Planctomycetales bacterium 10988]|nr:Hydroxymethylbilane synthase [Planctomycetales bacterium 10988]
MSEIRLRLGTRGSALAMWQANEIAGRLRALPEVEIEIIQISTQGDQQQQGPIGAIGTQGVFTKEIQKALLQKEVDLAVHSLKDLPTEPVPGLALTAVPERGPWGDVFVSQKFSKWEDLPEGAIIGTGSARRKTQLLHARADLDIRDIRGNVETRLKKLADGEYEAIILAEAGLVRLEFQEWITQKLAPPTFLPAVGQGALGLETREDDTSAREVLAQINHPPTWAAVVAERALLATLRGGCLAPVGALGLVDESGDLSLDGVVLSADGQERIAVQVAGTIDDPETLGISAAKQLLEQGADRLIEASRQN